MVALVLDGLVGFPAGLSPTSFYLSPTSFHLSPKLGACGRVRGWLVSHFLSFVSHFFSFPKQYTVRGSQCFKEWSPWCWMVWSGSRPACLPLPFICLPALFICLPGFLSFVSHFFSLVSQFFSFVSQAGCLWSGSLSHFLSFVSHFFSFVSQFFSFVSQAEWLWWVGFPAGLSPTSFYLSPTSFHLFPRLGACGPVPGWLVSHFLAFVSHFLLFVSHFFSFGPAGLSPTCLTCLPFPFNCLPVLFICLPRWMLVVGFLAGLSPTSFHLSPTSFHLSPSSFHLSPRLGACGRVPGWLVSHFLSFVSHTRCLWSGSRPACLPLPFNSLPLLFICLPGCLWSASRGFPAGLSPTSFPAGLSPTSLHLFPTFSPNSLLLGVLNSFLRCVRPLCHCWCPPISTGSLAV